MKLYNHWSIIECYTEYYFNMIFYTIMSYSINFTIKKLAPIVLGNWRFASPNKGLRSKTRAGKMWWSKTPQRAKPERCFAEPEPPEQGGEQLPFVMWSWGVYYFINLSINISSAFLLESIINNTLTILLLIL